MNRFVFEMETQFVLCEVRTDFYVLFSSRRCLNWGLAVNELGSRQCVTAKAQFSVPGQSVEDLW